MSIFETGKVPDAAVDTCFHALLADPRSEARPPPAHIPLKVVREAADARLALAPKLPVFSVADLEVPVNRRSIRTRLYRPADQTPLPVIVFLHGGGWVWGSIESHDSLCRSLAREAECAVLSVDYRLAPENPFPAGLQDARDVVAWLVANGESLGLASDRMAVCGDSSGGNLALALAAMPDMPMRMAGVFYPPLDPDCDSASQHRFATGHLLTREVMLWFWQAYLGAAQTTGPAEALLGHGDLSTLPPVSIGLAECDILHDEGQALAARLEKAGRLAGLRVYPGQIHAFVSLPHITPMAEVAIRDMARDLRQALITEEEGTAP